MKHHLTEIMQASEADERWGLPYGTVKLAINNGKFDDQIKKKLVRYSKRSENKNGIWLVTETAMKEIYGEKPREGGEDELK